MELTFKTFLIVCPLLFLTGFVDSIAGGGGIISITAYLLAGCPIHYAIGTNKLSSSMGTAVPTVRVLKRGYVKAKLAVPGIIVTWLGSTIGAKLSLLLDERVIKAVMLIMIPICLYAVLNKKLLKAVDECPEIDLKKVIVVCAISFIVGMYDGFYGPGAGTFFLIGYLVIAKLDMNTAYSQMKILNMTSGAAAFVTYLNGGKMLILLGLAGGIFNIGGNWLGSSLVFKNGLKLARPMMIFVIILLLIKIITEF